MQRSTALFGFISMLMTTVTFGFVAPSRTQSRNQQQSTQLYATATRAEFFKQVAFVVGSSAAAASGINVLPAFADETVTLENGVSYVIGKKGDGPKPTIGELAAIRFKCSFGDRVIDDIFETPEPYYTRVGSGGLLPGVEAVIPSMRVGDRFTLTIPSKMGFGSKGRPASAGKPRIPGDAILTFEIEMVGLPGKEQELIDIIGD